jgi:hypothetical protein
MKLRKSSILAIGGLVLLVGAAVTPSLAADTAAAAAQLQAECSDMTVTAKLAGGGVLDKVMLGLAPDGEGAVSVYQINDQGQGVCTMYFTKSQLDKIVPTVPDKNTFIASSGDIDLYRLTTGEYQVNAGPDFEGKVEVVVFNDLPASASHFSEFLLPHAY